LFLFLFLLLGTRYCVLSTIHAQDFTFEKAYQDYIFTQSQYQERLVDFQKAKDNYQKNQTLNLKETARQELYKLLMSREDLLRVYLIATRMKVLENKGLSNEEKQVQIKKIDTEIEWINTHKTKYQESDTVEDLTNKSKETESRYKTNTSISIYESLFYITYGELFDNKKSNLNVYSNLKKYIEKNVVENKFRIDPFNRWFGDIENAEKEITTNEIKAMEKIKKLYTENYNNPANNFNTTIAILEENLNKLGQLNNFVFELLNTIRLQLKLTK